MNGVMRIQESHKTQGILRKCKGYKQLIEHMGCRGYEQITKHTKNGQRIQAHKTHWI